MATPKGHYRWWWGSGIFQLLRSLSSPGLVLTSRNNRSLAQAAIPPIPIYRAAVMPTGSTSLCQLNQPCHSIVTWTTKYFTTTNALMLYLEAAPLPIASVDY